MNKFSVVESSVMSFWSIIIYVWIPQ